MRKKINHLLGAVLSLLVTFGLTHSTSAQPAPRIAADDEAPVTVTGDLTVLQADDFVNHRSEMIYSLKDAAGKTFHLRFDQTPLENLQTGDRVTVHGIGKGNEIAVAANGQGVETHSVAQAAVTGAQSTIVILLNFLDAPLECTPQAVNDLMFRNPTSVNTLYQETSYGNVSFAGVVVGPYTINYSSTGACDNDGWAAAGDAAATAAGYNLSQYTRRVYAFPANNTCTWAGLGTIGGNPSRAWIVYCGLLDIYAHELGHNLGMQHSSTPGCEYCDISDVMGYSGIGPRQVNAPHKVQMGWLPASKIVTATANMTVTIAPLELYPGATSLPQALKIKRPLPAKGDYYFSYRERIGFDSSLGSDYADKANVHTLNLTQNTYFLGSLVNGQSFTDTSKKNGFTVTQLAVTPDYVTLQVIFR
ncbi:MAG TPA: hypothetical protein VFA77_03880 [Candidatus Eisenbacteria bacterium]|nr:hypothetical protein [Candidatus Eisenbacteria bacterium]